MRGREAPCGDSPATKPPHQIERLSPPLRTAWHRHSGDCLRAVDPDSLDRTVAILALVVLDLLGEIAGRNATAQAPCAGDPMRRLEEQNAFAKTLGVAGSRRSLVIGNNRRDSALLA